MSLYDYWFEKQATARWLREFGRLSPRNQSLITSNVSRTPEQLSAGMLTGSQNILNRIGATSKRGAMIGGGI